MQSSGQPISRETLQAVAQEEASSVIEAASLGAAVAAFAAGKDPNIASGSAVTAMENNWVQTLTLAPEIAAFVTEGVTVAAGVVSALAKKKDASGEGSRDGAQQEKAGQEASGKGETLQDWSTSFRTKEDALPTTLTTPIHETGPTTFTTPIADPLPNIFATFPEENKAWTVSTPIGEMPGPTILWTPAHLGAPTTFFSQGESSKDIKPSPLLKGEGKVGTYGELDSSGKTGDNLSAHHMPNDNYMKSRGVSRKDGVSMNVEQPYPGKGGRHREIHKKLIRQDPSKKPRDALAESVKRAKEVYQKEGVYTSEIRSSLKEVIEKNKKKFPDLFTKKK